MGALTMDVNLTKLGLENSFAGQCVNLDDVAKTVTKVLSTVVSSGTVVEVQSTLDGITISTNNMSDLTGAIADMDGVTEFYKEDIETYFLTNIKALYNTKDGY